MKISILIPAYNEVKTMPAVMEKLEHLREAALDFEVVAVDDASRDGTLDWLENAEKERRFSFPIKILSHSSNQGKGAAVRTAVNAAGGEVLVIQDADLEYDPSCIPELVEPILKGEKDVMYGSRMLSGKSQTYSRLYLMGNKFLTWTTNFLCGSQMTDSYTGYKAFKREIVKDMELSSRGFELEAELSVKVAMRGVRFGEIPIVYHCRSREEGKKICGKDAVYGLWTIFKTWYAERKHRQ